MRTISLEISDDIFTRVLDFLRLLPKESLKIRVDEDDDIFTEEDREMYEQAMRELGAGETVSLEQAKKELDMLTDDVPRP